MATLNELLHYRYNHIKDMDSMFDNSKMTNMDFDDYNIFISIFGLEEARQIYLNNKNND